MSMVCGTDGPLGEAVFLGGRLSRLGVSTALIGPSARCSNSARPADRLGRSLALPEQKNQEGTRWVEGWVASVIRPLASCSPSEDGPFVARVPVLFLSTDGVP